MTTEYFIRVRNRAGVRQEDIGDFLSLNYTKTVNDIGSLNFDISGQHRAIDAFEKDGQIEVWRSDQASGIPWYCDFFGLYRTRNRRTPRNSPKGIFTAKCVGQLDFLRRAFIAFPAGTANRNMFSGVPAETIMKLMVQYNASPDATTVNDRIRNVGSWANYITVESDGASGTSLTKSWAHKKLLPTLQEVAALGGLDFNLVKTGAQAWEFRTYPLLGVDRTGDVKFSLTWGNMGEPQLIGNDDDATVAIIGGENSGAARDFAVRTGPNYVAGYNDIETFVNASGQALASLDAVGDAKLNELRAKDDLNFEILETPAYRYGRDYCFQGELGDKVDANYAEGSVVKKFRGVSVVVQASSGGQKAEQIRANLVTVL